MSKRVLFVRSGLALWPADDAAREAMSKIKAGQAVYLTPPVQARNPRQHRLYFALIGILWDHVDHGLYATREQLDRAVRCSVGWHDPPVTLKDGRVMVHAKSISFANMPQAEFEQFLNKVIDKVCQEIIPGLEPGTLRDELEEMVGT